MSKKFLTPATILIILGALIGTCCDLMDIKAKASGVQLERVTGKGLDQVVCDRRAGGDSRWSN